MARPAEFDREEVLDRAMQAFWDDGYCATSMATLTETTGLKPGSLYAAFKSKEGLFLSTLDHYGERSTESIRKVLHSTESPLEGVRTFLTQLASNTANQSKRSSCFLVNTLLEIARSNDQVRDRVNAHLDRVEKLFLDALEQAQAQGELSNDQDPAALASFIMTNIWGMRVLLAAGADQRKAGAVVNQLLSILR